MSSTPHEPVDEPTEEQLRATYEAELKRITSADVVLQTAVSLINLGGRRLGLGGAQDERDLEQVRDAIDGVRGLMPVLERRAGPDIGAIRNALSQLQLAYAREAQATPTGAAEPAAPGGGGASGGEAGDRGGGAGEPGSAGPQPAGGGQQPREGEEQRSPGPAESSGRLWVPGQ